jgi:hypothetical protein
MAVIRFKRHRLIKYLILIPIIWLAYVMLFGTSSEKVSKRSKEDQEIIDRLLRKVDRKTEELKELKLQTTPVGVDKDHPDEERKKAEIQEKEVKGRVQVDAPVEVNPNAPGLSYFFLGIIYLETDQIEIN